MRNLLTILLTFFSLLGCGQQGGDPWRRNADPISHPLEFKRVLVHYNALTPNEEYALLWFTNFLRDSAGGFEGVWDQLVLTGMGTEANSLVDMTGNVNMTNVGATWTQWKGFRGTGADGVYVNTNLLDQYNNATTQDAFFGHYIPPGWTSTEATAFEYIFGQRQTASSIQISIYDERADETDGRMFDTGDFARSNATNIGDSVLVYIWRDGTTNELQLGQSATILDTNAASTPTGFPTDFPIFLMAHNQEGNHNFESDFGVGAWMAGKGSTVIPAKVEYAIQKFYRIIQYSPQAQALIVNLPDDLQDWEYDAAAQLYDDLQAHDQLKRFDNLWSMMQGTEARVLGAPLIGDSLLTYIGEPSFVSYTGVDLDGVNDALNTHALLSRNADGFSMVWYGNQANDLADDNSAIFGLEEGLIHSHILRTNDPNGFTGAFNTTNTVVTDEEGIIILSPFLAVLQQEGGNAQIWIDSTMVESGTPAVVGKPTFRSVYVGANNDDGVPKAFGAQRVKLFGIAGPNVNSLALDWAFSRYDSTVIANTSGGPGDTEDPVVGTMNAATNIVDVAATLSWTAATDNIGVVGYDVYHEDIFLKTVAGTSTGVSGLSASTLYEDNYVIARDAAANSSAESNHISFTTTGVPAGGPLTSSNDILTSTVIWETEEWSEVDQRYGDNTHGNSYWLEADTMYIVWTDLGLRPKVTRVRVSTQAVIDSVHIDASDYTAKPDDHNRFSIAVTSDGYIHITGDMHGYNQLGGTIECAIGTNANPSGPADPLIITGQSLHCGYPPRYHTGTIMHWISNVPWSITSGFTWVGGTPALAINGYAHSYMEFTEDHTTNTVWAYARNRMYFGGHGAGENGFSVWKYNSGDRTWGKIGAIPPQIPSTGWTPTEVALMHADGAINREGTVNNFYQSLTSDITFDHNGDLHVAVSFAVDTTNDRSDTHTIYAKSTDQGSSWKKANGTTISGLPITNVNGDLVVDDDESWASAFASVTGQENGDPIIMMHGTNGGSEDKFHRWNGSAWIRESTDIPGTTKNWIHLGNDGVYTMIRHGNDDIERTRDIVNETSYVVTAQAFQTCCVKEQAIRESGNKGDVFIWARTNDSPEKLQLILMNFSNAETAIWP